MCSFSLHCASEFLSTAFWSVNSWKDNDTSMFFELYPTAVSACKCNRRGKQ